MLTALSQSGDVIFAKEITSDVVNALENAKKNGYDIVLYGHTHVSKILYENGVYVVNPGSCSCGRDFHESYAVIDIEKNGIMPIIVKL